MYIIWNKIKVQVKKLWFLIFWVGKETRSVGFCTQLLYVYGAKQRNHLIRSQEDNLNSTEGQSSLKNVNN